MWALLGDVQFELLFAPEQADLTARYNYAEHPVIEGKPKVQWTGDALKERNWTIRLHSVFCDPDVVMIAIRSMAGQHQAQALSLGTGEFLGRYVITEIHELTLVTDAAGGTVSQTADIRLKEWIGQAASDSGEAVATTDQPVAGMVTTSDVATSGLETVVPDSEFAAATDLLDVSPQSALQGLARAAELGPLALADLAAAIPGVAEVGAALGAGGLSGLSGLSAALQVTAGAGLSAASAVGDWLGSLATPGVAIALAAHGVDLAGALLTARGGDVLEPAVSAVRQALGGDLAGATAIFGEGAASQTVQVLAGNMPVYRTIRDAATAYAAGSDSLAGLRQVLRVGV